MMKRMLLLASVALTVATVAPADSSPPAPSVPKPIAPEAFQWQSPPNFPGVQGAWVVGAEKEPGAYVFRVRLMPGARIPPHTHPDSRHTTVLSGTLYVGFGDMYDESKLVAVPTGSVYVAPAGVPHFLLARDGEVVYQEGGIGPTATIPTPRKEPHGAP